MNKKKDQEKSHTMDVLEAYPEREQVASFPERRYIKMIRFLTIMSIINIAIIMGLAGIYYYLSQNIDISIEKNGRTLFYSIDPEKQIMIPTEKNNSRASALEIVMEETILNYLNARYTYVYDLDKMDQRWINKDGDTDVLRFSDDDVKIRFSENIKSISNSLFQRRVVRDVIIHDLYHARGDLWSAYIETFDFQLDENLNRSCDCKCDCLNKSEECLRCKAKNTISRKRYKIWLRADFFPIKGKSPEELLKNPFNILVYKYHELGIRIPNKDERDKETFWGLPTSLRSDLY